MLLLLILLWLLLGWVGSYLYLNWGGKRKIDGFDYTLIAFEGSYLGPFALLLLTTKEYRNQQWK